MVVHLVGNAGPTLLSLTMRPFWRFRWARSPGEVVGHPMPSSHGLMGLMVRGWFASDCLRLHCFWGSPGDWNIFSRRRTCDDLRITPLTDWKGPAENWKGVTIIKDEYLARSDANNSGNNSGFVQSVRTQLQSHTTFSSDKLGVHNNHRCNTLTWLCPNLWLYRHYTHKLVIKETYGPVLSPTYGYNFGIPSFQFFFHWFPRFSHGDDTMNHFESRRMSLCTFMRRGENIGSKLDGWFIMENPNRKWMV